MSDPRKNETPRGAVESHRSSTEIDPTVAQMLGIDIEVVTERTALAEDMDRQREANVLDDLEDQLDEAAHDHDHQHDHETPPEPTTNEAQPGTKKSLSDQISELVVSFKNSFTGIWESIQSAISSILSTFGSKIDKPEDSPYSRREELEREFEEEGYQRYPAVNPSPYTVQTRVEDFEGKEPSGIVYMSEFDCFFMVHDEGEILKLSSDYTIEETWEIGGDLEGITYDPGTNLIYVIVEGSQVLKELSYVDGEMTLTGNEWDLSSLIPYHDDMSGVEALTFANGYFYVGDQHDGTIHIIDIRNGGANEVGIIHPPNGISKDMSGLFYDEDTGLIYAIWDKYNRLALLDVSTNEFVYQFELPEETSAQEGITLDAYGNLHIAEDTGGTQQYS